jgi:hypothetical protein
MEAKLLVFMVSTVFLATIQHREILLVNTSSRWETINGYYRQ